VNDGDLQAELRGIRTSVDTLTALVAALHGSTTGSASFGGGGGTGGTQFGGGGGGGGGFMGAGGAGGSVVGAALPVVPPELLEWLRQHNPTLADQAQNVDVGWWHRLATWLSSAAECIPAAVIGVLLTQQLST
jgi:hypothetical protein